MSSMEICYYRSFVCFSNFSTLFSSCNLSYHDSNIKQGTMSALGEPTKSNPFMAGGILYPCTSANSRDTLQSQMASDSRLLWATLTPHGTRHFITDYPAATAPETNGHYEVVDYRSKTPNQPYRDYVKRTPIKVCIYAPPPAPLEEVG